MDFLLDTHTYIWALTEPNRIPSKTFDQMCDLASGLYVSAVTPFEISTKVRIGKFAAADAVLEGFGRRIDEIRAVELPITSDHAIVAGRMNWSHRDPFDRLLAAQAIVENLTLVSADAIFSEVSGLRLLWK